MLTYISLGWGVQSWTLAAMVALGELPSVDAAIHSDTGWERQSTYEFAATWTPWLESRGVPVVTVHDKKPATVATNQTDIPAFTAGTSAKGGQLRRQCTGDWKIKPMRRYISQQLSQVGAQKTPGIVEQWLGITQDEWHRAKDSDVAYITHKYPLLDRNMTRANCITWLQKNNLPAPDKSACVFCPYHNRAAWQRMRAENGADWRTAVSVDSAIRNTRPPHLLYVHPDRIPLESAVLTPEMFGMTQTSLIPDEECDSGYCFL